MCYKMVKLSGETEMLLYSARQPYYTIKIKKKKKVECRYCKKRIYFLLKGKGSINESNSFCK